ncbi:MAG: carboxy terminal-processing peptidase [Pirellulaceae bacterium]|nr:carboxy terminal-processing peptidase [Pirellulaceae bacterium]
MRLKIGLILGLLTGLALAYTSQSWADDPKLAAPRVSDMAGQRASDARIVKTVAALMTKVHLANQPLDDEISRRAYDSMLKLLDPLKIYFLQSDIDALSKNRDKIDDFVQAGKMDFAIELYQLFLKRLDERIAAAHQYVDTEHDFTIQESIAREPKKIEYPKDTAEANDRMRKQVKFRMLSLESDRIRAEQDLQAGKQQSDLERVLIGDPNEDPRERLHRSYRTLHKRWQQFDANELLELYVSALTTSFDPHTSYMSPSTQKNFMISMKLNLDGIGAQLTSEDGYTKLTSIVPGGAADKDGRLKPGDRIVAVGQGQEGPVEDVIDMKLDEVVQRIRGQAGTIVRLIVLPASGGESQVYNITRAKITLEDSAARSQIVDYPLEDQQASATPFRVGYIDLPSFYMDMEAARRNSNNFRSTTRDVRKILADFRDQSVDVVVLDLSRNGGGSLTEAINLTGLFIDRGPVVQVKNPQGQVQVYEDEESGVAWNGPLIVMTSKESASASEILAGAIQDYGRGLIVGDPATHGKGTVQSLYDLSEELLGGGGPAMGALKITIQQFYLPAGKSTQRQGVMSDLILPQITAEIDNGEADLDYALPNDTVTPTRFSKYNLVNSTLLADLRAKSMSRVRESDGFAKTLRRIDLYRQQKGEEFISLNREEFLKRRAELDAQREEEEQSLESQIPKKEVFRMDHYNREVLNISKDYYDALNKLNLANAG